MSLKKSSDTIWDRTSDLLICSTAPKPLCHRGPPDSLITDVIAQSHYFLNQISEEDYTLYFLFIKFLCFHKASQD